MVATGKRVLESSLGAAIVGGLVVGLLGWLAIAAGWIQTPSSTPDLVPQPLARNASDEGGGSSVNQIYEATSPGVAYIQARSVAREPSPFDPFGTPQERTASGSGFVVDGEGHILTNNHVVEDSSDIKVALGSDRATIPAELVGADPSNDLALLKIDPGKANLRPIPLGDSSKVEVGDPVVAIGNPFGLDRTVTTGIVSALQRQIRAPNGFTISNVLQTDASIKPGNSGGPLIDAGGTVVGINSQIETAGGRGSVGVGFAVPIDTARKAIDQLRSGGEVKRPYLGIDGTEITPDLAGALNLPVDEGVLVQHAVAGGPAAKAGVEGGTTQASIDGNEFLLGGDIITAVDGRKVTGMDEVIAAVDAKDPGQKVVLQLVRDRERKDVTVTLGERPAQVQE